MHGGDIRGAITPGEGDIYLTDSSPDTVLSGDPKAFTGNLIVTADRDIVIDTQVTANYRYGANPGSMNFTADADGDGVGGVLIRDAGKLTAAADVTLTGADVYRTVSVATPPAPQFQVDAEKAVDSIHIEADTDDGDADGDVQIQAAGSITLTHSSAVAVPATADIIIDGKIIFVKK